MVVAVFIGETASTLKFGSMDTNAILNNDMTLMSTFRTADLNSWSI